MRQSKYNGRSAYKAMVAINKLREETRRFFYWDCELWRAIQKHIEKEDDNCAFFDLPAPIKYYRGTGASIVMRGFHAYGDQYKQDHAIGKDHATWKTIVTKPDVFEIEFDVEYEDSDDDYRRSYRLNVPISLLTDFTQEAFNKWIDDKLAEKNRQRLDLDKKTIKEILARNPDILNQL